MELEIRRRSLKRGRFYPHRQVRPNASEQLQLQDTDTPLLSVTCSPLRTSSLAAPIMLLTGHAGEVFCAEFSPDGRSIASGAFDRQIYLWNTHEECQNYAATIAHAGAILDIHWSSDGDKLYTASSDKTCAVWDAHTGERIRRLRGHASIVNCCSPARKSPMLASGSDDGTIKVGLCTVYSTVRRATRPVDQPAPPSTDLGYTAPGVRALTWQQVPSYCRSLRIQPRPSHHRRPGQRDQSLGSSQKRCCLCNEGRVPALSGKRRRC